jgi:hypothetical protein
VLEQNEEDRAIFRNIVNTHYCPEQLVFADKSHFNQLTVRRPYVWSKHGKHAYQYELQFEEQNIQFSLPSPLMA